MNRFFAELKRRKVYSVAVAYIVAGWALAQGVAQVFPVFDIPNWAVRLVIVAIVLGFPIALVLSWFFDFTRHGIVRTPDLKDEIDVLPAVSSTERSIAVLPFTDLSPGEGRDYFGEGIAEEIQTALAKIEGLRVAARRSSFWFKDKKADLKEIADKLNVEHVLEGSVRRDGNRIRISAELTDCCNGFTLWSETFERALEKDPQFGRAWTGIAKAWLWLADAYVAPLEAYSKVREAATNALTIDNDDAEAHVYLGETKRILDWDMDGAAREFRRAVELDPKSTPSNYFSAAFWAARGERDEALVYLQRTSTIDPGSLWVNNSACELYRYFGLYDEAMAAGERALELDPAFVYGEPLLGALYREMGQFDKAIELYAKAQRLNGRPGFGIAITYARMDRPDEARGMLAKAVASRGSYTPGDAIAHVHVALGAHDDAIRELERACSERSSSLHFVGIAPEFEPLRSDKRFLSILRKIGLEPTKVFAAGAAR
ncbi:MAG: hypothetical protein DME35_02105 [Verrucomicrobia bacterium]|nr:MAG: hypothetical protein DME35_02105 [Verrucomicrobiota bacterium]